ncbi:MAG: hypothetical protein JRH18_18880 [Deltaproteobacteria bacterium]|nr:hypothetical protein [Deltaproteobacteria bacterium]
MTHSLHRVGPYLDEEIVFILTPSKGINSEGAEEKIKKFLEIIVNHKPVHYGDDRVGNRYTAGYDQIVENLEEVTNIHAVFNDLNTAKQVLKDLVEADLGLSIVVSGLFENAKACCEAAGIHYHSIEHSLGIWGDRARLPDEKTLSILTMCGHGLVSVNLIQAMAESIRNKEKTAQQAAEEMARLCLCGIFNTERAALILKEMASVSRAGTKI